MAKREKRGWADAAQKGQFFFRQAPAARVPALAFAGSGGAAGACLRLRVRSAEAGVLFPRDDDLSTQHYTIKNRECAMARSLFLLHFPSEYGS